MAVWISRLASLWNRTQTMRMKDGPLMFPLSHYCHSARRGGFRVMLFYHAWPWHCVYPNHRVTCSLCCCQTNKGRAAGSREGGESSSTTQRAGCPGKPVDRVTAAVFACVSQGPALLSPSTAICGSDNGAGFRFMFGRLSQKMIRGIIYASHS